MKAIPIMYVVTAGAIGLMVVADDRVDKDSGGASLAPKLEIDKSPPDRTGPHGGYADIVERVSPSVVSVFTSRESVAPEMGLKGLPDFFQAPGLRDFFGNRRPEMRPRVPRNLPKARGLGSGVILSSDGYVLTNNHVVEGADEIRVRLFDGKEHDATIVATDPSSDLAVVKVDAEGLPAATIGDSDGLRPGDFVLAIGSPFGLNQTVTSGIVSAIGRDDLNITGYEDFIQTDASINPGNSGGALIDNGGRVVGINTAILSRSGGNVGIGFAIPVNMAVEIAGELIDSGAISRGYLGVALGPLTKELAQALGVEKDGVVVNDVMPDTPAEKAGFEPGDVIVACNGEKVEDVADLRMMVGRKKPGATLKLDVRRDGEPMNLEAVIGKMPEDMLASSGGTPPAPADEGTLKGVRLGKLDAATRERLGLSGAIDGALVLEVDPSSKAAEAGLRPGNVITEVNRRKVTSPREAYTAAGETGDKATLLRVTDGKTNRFLAIG